MFDFENLPIPTKLDSAGDIMTKKHNQPWERSQERWLRYAISGASLVFSHFRRFSKQNIEHPRFLFFSSGNFQILSLCNSPPL